MKFEIYCDKASEWRWRLKASNGKIIADSAEGYKSILDLDDAIELIKEEVATAEEDVV